MSTYIGYTCAHCGGGHMGINCTEKEKVYVVPVLLSIPAKSYLQAVESAREVVDSFEDAGVGIEVETYFEHDNIGQRVLYLHPEEDPDYENTHQEEDDG